MVLRSYEPSPSASSSTRMWYEGLASISSVVIVFGSVDSNTNSRPRSSCTPNIGYDNNSGPAIRSITKPSGTCRCSDVAGACRSAWLETETSGTSSIPHKRASLVDDRGERMTKAYSLQRQRQVEVRWKCGNAEMRKCRGLRGLDIRHFQHSS